MVRVKKAMRALELGDATRRTQIEEARPMRLRDQLQAVTSTSLSPQGKATVHFLDNLTAFMTKCRHKRRVE